MTDLNFPILDYKDPSEYRKNGLMHGEEFRREIKELLEIRKELLLLKNPRIRPHLKEMAKEQYEFSFKFNSDVSTEMKAIAFGANIPLEDLVLLNNYTDFRDISLPEEGCSTIQSVNTIDSVSGQTWDMHGSAKRFLSVIKIKGNESTPAQLIFSIVGCVGMMGYSSNGLMVGVNNLNTLNAQNGLIWPILVREVLLSKTYENMEKTLINAPVTSGHNYLISSSVEGAHWEVTPKVKEQVSRIGKGNSFIYHTNHCLGENSKKEENSKSISLTTENRYQLLKETDPLSLDLEKSYQLLNSHEGYPKSICSHFNNGSSDPSMTCGGAIGSFKQNKFIFWRGCSKYDQNYVDYKFKLSEDKRVFNQV